MKRSLLLLLGCGGLFAQTPVPDTVLIDRNVEYSAVRDWDTALPLIPYRATSSDIFTTTEPCSLAHFRW